MSLVKRMLKNAQTSKPVTLQLTAMVDMFTILVVFLLKSMSVTAIKLPPDELRLPTAFTGDEPKEALLIQIAPAFITVNDKKVAILENGKIKATDIAKDDLYMIPALEKELLAEAEKSKEIQKKTNSLVQFKGTVFIQAHKDLDYGLLKKVFYTSSVAGYGDLRLATINGGE